MNSKFSKKLDSITNIFEQAAFDAITHRLYVETIEIGYFLIKSHQAFGLSLIKIYFRIHVKKDFLLTNSYKIDRIDELTRNKYYKHQKISRTTSIVLENYRKNKSQEITSPPIKKLKEFYMHYTSLTSYIYRQLIRYFPESSIYIKSPKEDLNFWLLNTLWEKISFDEKDVKYEMGYGLDTINICSSDLFENEKQHNEIYKTESPLFCVSISEILAVSYINFWLLLDVIFDFKIPYKINITTVQFSINTHLLNFISKLESLIVDEKIKYEKYNLIPLLLSLEKLAKERSLNIKILKSTLNRLKKLVSQKHSIVMCSNDTLGRINKVYLAKDLTIELEFNKINTNLKISKNRTDTVKFSEVIGIIPNELFWNNIKTTSFKRIEQVVRLLKNKKLAAKWFIDLV